ncbi:hypothetical protein L6R49_15045 [Myxococcota bacterium]|nr:hypothetical protein [Myxococcota bacterium]
MSDRHPSLDALARLLAQWFTAAQLRDLLAREHGARFLRQLPEDTEDATLLAHAAVTALARAGQLDERLLLALIGAAPQQREQLEAVARGLGIWLTPSALLAAATAPPTPPATEGQPALDPLRAQRTLARQLLDGPVRALTAARLKGEVDPAATAVLVELVRGDAKRLTLGDLRRAVTFFAGLGPDKPTKKDGSARYDDATSLRWAEGLATLRQIGQLTDVELRRLATLPAATLASDGADKARTTGRGRKAVATRGH